jgi:hypothetical protein
MTEEAKGFLGRWARRKNDVLLGKPLVEPDVQQAVPAVAPLVPRVAGAESVPATVNEEEPLPALSLDDVKLLTKDSDFKPFMARNVGPDVRNAAMKKLFEDPHFNVMDGLDIYIDDYSISEPIPESMLRQMASAKFLNLFEEEKDEKEQQGERSDEVAVVDVEGHSTVDVSQAGENIEVDAEPAADTTAQTLPLTDPANPALQSASAGLNPYSQPQAQSAFVASQENHADPYLRLQPDDASSDPEAGRST